MKMKFEFPKIFSQLVEDIPKRFKREFSLKIDMIRQHEKVKMMI